MVGKLQTGCRVDCGCYVQLRSLQIRLMRDISKLSGSHIVAQHLAMLSDPFGATHLAAILARALVWVAQVLTHPKGRRRIFLARTVFNRLGTLRTTAVIM